MTPAEEAEKKKREAQFRSMRPAGESATAPPAQQTPAPGPVNKPAAQPAPRVTPRQTPISQAAAGGVKVPTSAERAIGAGNRFQFRAKARPQQTPLAPMQKLEAAKPKQGQTPFPSAAGATGSSTQSAMNFSSPGTTTDPAGSGPRNTVGAVADRQRPLVGLGPVAGEATTPAVMDQPADTGERIEDLIDAILAEDPDLAAERAALEAQYEADRGRQLVDARAAGGLAGLGLSGGQQLLEGDIANAAMRQEAIGLGDFDRAARTEELARQQLALGALTDREMRDLYLEIYGEEREAQKEDEAEADRQEAAIEGLPEGGDILLAAAGIGGMPTITEQQAKDAGLMRDTSPASTVIKAAGGVLWTDGQGQYWVTR